MNAEQTKCAICKAPAIYFTEIYDPQEIFKKDGMKCIRTIFLCEQHHIRFCLAARNELIRMKWSHNSNDGMGI